MMADAMDRVRAAEARYQEVIERTTQLDRHVKEVEVLAVRYERARTGLNLRTCGGRQVFEHQPSGRPRSRREAETCEVGRQANLRSELEREERAAKDRAANRELNICSQSGAFYEHHWRNRLPHGSGLAGRFFPVGFTALFCWGTTLAIL